VNNVLHYLDDAGGIFKYKLQKRKDWTRY